MERRFPGVIRLSDGSVITRNHRATVEVPNAQNRKQMTVLEPWLPPFFIAVSFCTSSADVGAYRIPTEPAFSFHLREGSPPFPQRATDMVDNAKNCVACAE
jgi:hypothetical protein